MSEPRLKTAIWVQACVRRGDIEGYTVTVAQRGERESGTVLVKLNRFENGCSVLSETRDVEGRRAWMRGTGPAPVSEAEADAYIARNRKFDPDLWVLEVEDRKGRLPFDEKIL